MEAAAKIQENHTGAESLAEQLQNYLNLHNLKPASIAPDVGYSRVSITRYLSGTYGSDVSGIERNVARFLSEHTDNVVEIPAAAQKKAQKPRFFESRDAKAVLGVCQSCQEYVSMGVVTASSGLGKTHALREYAKLPHVVYIECGGSMCRSDIVNAIENGVGLPHRRGTVWQREEAIFEFFNYNKGYLLIIDEADKLINNRQFSKIEVLREIYDHSSVGIVFAGEPELIVLIKTYLDRIAKRTVFKAELKGLAPSEVEDYLNDFDVAPDAMLEFKSRACGTRRSCFRLLDRTLSNVQRILEGREDQTITAKVVEQASAMMML